ncbi:acetylcholinesterase-like [Trichoplusia ni]|uniref:Carboxylic ester hydrolase n=1 Tax=Trichoplusia ni TaxID=7111 RepID=A0A7E5X3H7_TRINI|nr:acetylcholinesterase-like [Trichoplusia ni]
MFFLKLFVFSSVLVCVFPLDPSVVSVKTSIGEVLGRRGDHFTTFLGLPYGDVDDNDPLGPATPHPDFETPFEAFSDLALCPQFVDGEATGTVHCLQLNVYTPNHVTAGDKLPVMVYIHGGAFVEGNSRLSTFSPKFLIRHDVIVVAIHYRLGAFGFICPRRKEYRNQGLKDQFLALKWVKRVIKDFGGDNGNVTLIGHSAGSISADLLLLNTEGLFNKVILQSGNAATPTFIEDNSQPTENIQSNVVNMMDREFKDLVSNMNISYILESTSNVTFRVCFDELVKKTPDSDLEGFKIMLGTTWEEGLFLYPNAVEDRNFTENFNYSIILKNTFPNIDDRGNEIVKNFYLQNGVVDFSSDYIFNYPSERSVRYYLRNNAVVYRYIFNYDGGRNYMKVMKNITIRGTTHADELGYLFDMSMFDTNISDADQLMIDRMTSLWTNFAKYGDPTPSPSPVLPVRWSPTTADQGSYLDLDAALSLRSGGPFERVASFWDLFYHHYAKFYKGIDLHDLHDFDMENGSVMISISYYCIFLLMFKFFM